MLVFMSFDSGRLDSASGIVFKGEAYPVGSLICMMLSKGINAIERMDHQI